MVHIKQSSLRNAVARGFAAIVASAVLAGCATHQGGQRMQMGAMRESPMHQMMQEMGCAHSPAERRAMEKLAPDEKQAHMKAHMRECKAKLLQRATGDAMARINQCIEEQATTRHMPRVGAKKMRAMMVAEIRACAGKAKADSVQPAEPTEHEGH